MTKPNIEELIALAVEEMSMDNNHETTALIGKLVQTLQSQAERIEHAEIRESKLHKEFNRVDLENQALRAQLDQIAATEPYCFHWVDRWGCNHYADPKESIGPKAQPLFTRPMPAQDVTELVERKPIFTTGHCKEKQKPGGCQLHNLQCGYPKCDRGPTIDLGRYAGTYGGYIKKEQP